jgi:hypothetical protein
MEYISDTVVLPIMITVIEVSILSVPDKGYSRNASCVLNLISTFLLAANKDSTEPGIANSKVECHHFDTVNIMNLFTVT